MTTFARWRGAERSGLAARQFTPAIGAAFYRPIDKSYQLQPSFHPSSTEPEPTARARRAGEEFYQTTPEFMFVSFRLLVVDSIQPASTFTEPSLLIRTSRGIRRVWHRRFIFKRAQNTDPRVSATPLSRWTITPLLYSRSTDLPVLRGRRCVRGALERLQTGEL